jgi:hypothetical protein
MPRKKLYTEEEKKEKAKLYYQKYYILNKEMYARTSKRYRHTEKGKSALEKARKKQRDNLSDNYIRQNLASNLYNCGGYSLDRKSVPKEVIEISRQTILAKRQFKLLQS